MKRVHPRVARPAPRLLIQPGQPAVCDGRAVQIVDVSDACDILVSVYGTNESLRVRAGDLSAYRDVAEAPVKISSPNRASPRAERNARSWARALSKLPPTGGATSAQKQKIADRLGVGVRTVARRYASYIVNPTPASQLKGTPGPAVGSKYLSARVEAIIDERYQSYYLKPERPPMSAFHEQVRVACRRAGVRVPDIKTLAKRVALKDPLVRARKRLGREEGDARQAPAVSGIKTTRALQVVQVDHALVDVMVVSDDTREEIGRPWITLAIDVHTRVVVGWYLTIDPPTQTSVALCIEHLCFPKDAWFREIGVEANYPVFGTPERLDWDNAWTFKAKAITAQCSRRGIEINLRPVRKPHWGSYIERYIGTFMGRVHLLPGTTFSNVKQRGQYDSQGRATMTLSELKRWAALEIVGRYFHAPHDGIGGLTPAQKWAHAWTDADGRVHLPSLIGDRTEFVVGFLPYAFRKVGREGYSVNAMYYWDPALAPFVNDKKRHKIHFRQDKIASTWLQFDGAMIEIPLADRTIPNCSLRELRLAKAALRAEGRNPNQTAALCNAIERMRAVEDEAATLSRRARRHRASRPADPAKSEPPIVDYSIGAEPYDRSLGRVK